MKQYVNLNGNIIELDLPDTLEELEREVAYLDLELPRVQMQIMETEGRKAKNALEKERIALAKRRKILRSLKDVGRTKIMKELAATPLINSKEIAEDNALLAKQYRFIISQLLKQLSQVMNREQMDAFMAEIGHLQALDNTLNYKLAESGYLRILNQVGGENFLSDLEKSETRNAMNLIKAIQSQLTEESTDDAIAS